MKPGFLSSEFWLTVAADVAATVLLVTNHITATEWATVTGGTGGLYALLRSVVKAKLPLPSAPPPAPAAPPAPGP